MKDQLILKNYKVSPLTMVFLIDGNKILTLKRASVKKIYPNKRSGFGGKVEPGEELFSSAKREFLEETGLSVKELSLRGSFTRILNTGFVNVMYLFIARGYSGKLKAETEEGITSWRKIDEFLNDPEIVDHIPHYLKQVIDGGDFYCGIGIYSGEHEIQYIDNRSHFEERKNNL